MPSPVRRSTRAVSSNGKPPPPTSTASSSSLSSAKLAKANKEHAKSATPHSISSEDPSDAPRRSKRSHPHHEEEVIIESAEHDDAAADEEEVTRCICGQQEYPGPPQSEAFSAADAQSEDAGGLFIQCDGCSVWQHGGCVGIVEESLCPDKYYCEECKPKQHDVHVDSRGQKYSLYLPLHPKAHRTSSVSKYDEKARKERESVVSRGSTEPGKRRGTMRSKEHDDEEEQLQRAIEESKRDTEGTTNGRRSGKRSRDESEESKEAKRPRRTSESAISMTRTASQGYDSEDENGMLTNSSKAKKARAEANLTARNAEMREKEKVKAQERAEAAGRRQERAGRRRADEGDPGDDQTPNPTSRRSPLASSPQASPPPPPATAPAVTQPTRRGPGKRTKKLGNNQYTKARELAVAGGTISSPHSKKRQMANMNGGNASGDENGGGIENKNSPFPDMPTSNANGKGRYGKGKGKGHNGVNGNGGSNKQPTTEEMESMKSIPNIRRAIDGMQAFVTKTQLEMAGDRMFASAGDASKTANNGLGVGVGGGPVQSPLSSSGDGSAGTRSGSGAGEGKEFQTLSAMEMADVISRNIHRWQSLYGTIAAS